MNNGEDSPGDILALKFFNRGQVLARSRKPREAITSYQVALTIKPDFAQAHEKIGNLRVMLGELGQAIISYKRAVAIKPDFAQAYYNLGNACRIQEQLGEALEYFEQAISIRPNYAKAHSNMGNIFARQGKFDLAVASYRRALSAKPTLSQVHSDLLFVEQARPGNTSEILYKMHREWDERQALVSKDIQCQHTNSLDPARCLRIGFVSADLRRHPVGYFVVLLFENLSSLQIKSFVYSDRRGDRLTHRIRAAVDIWCDSREFSNNQLFKKIIDDEIDILVDLAGHTGGNRLPVFFRKPAPLQVTWAGYTGTTGLSAMDYVIADPYAIKESEEKYSSETIIRMPHCYISYSPAEYAPDIEDLPYLKNSVITFGCFNHPRKLNHNLLEVWSSILEVIPHARLLFNYKSIIEPHNIERITSVFHRRDIDLSRLDFRVGTSRNSHKQFLDCYNQVDIGLDSFPYSGGLTTLESLWMGVPVITLPGETFASRHSLGYLSILGLRDLIAQNQDDYIKIAQNLSDNIGYLKTLRATLRDRVKNSPICDGKGFARAFTNNMRRIWENRCQDG